MPPRYEYGPPQQPSSPDSGRDVDVPPAGVQFTGDPRRVVGHPGNPFTDMAGAYEGYIGAPQPADAPPLDPGRGAPGFQERRAPGEVEVRVSRQEVHNQSAIIGVNAGLPEGHEASRMLQENGIAARPVASLNMGGRQHFVVVDMSGSPLKYGGRYVDPFTWDNVRQHESPEFFPALPDEKPNLAIVYRDQSGKLSAAQLEEGKPVFFGRTEAFRERNPTAPHFHIPESESHMSRFHGFMEFDGKQIIFSDTSTNGTIIETDGPLGVMGGTVYDQRINAARGAGHLPPPRDERGEPRHHERQARRPEIGAHAAFESWGDSELKSMQEMLRDVLQSDSLRDRPTAEQNDAARDMADAAVEVLKSAILRDENNLQALLMGGGNQAVRDLLRRAQDLHRDTRDENVPSGLEDAWTKLKEQPNQEVAAELLGQVQEQLKRADPYNRPRTLSTVAVERAFAAFDVLEAIGSIARSRQGQVLVDLEPARMFKNRELLLAGKQQL